MVNLNYRIDGKGPNVLLLHAVGVDLTFLDAVAAKLAENFTVLRMDLRGHGQSPYEPASSLYDFADDVHALLAELKFAPCAVAGFAFGGMVTQALAVKYPQDVRAVVISSCTSAQTPESAKAVAARGTDAKRDGIASLLDVTMQRWLNDDFRQKGGDAATRARLLSTDVCGWADAWHAMSTIDVVPRLGEVKVPALCLVGEFDKSTPPPIVKAIADRIPGARYQVLPGGPHMLFIEQPDETAKAVGEFLKDVLT